MQIELKVPALGESITEVEIGPWLKREGEAVAKDENVVVIESEKSSLELAAPSAGVLAKILKSKGQTATVGELIGYLDTEAVADAKPAEPKKEAPKAGAEAAPAAEKEVRVMPAAARLMAEHGLSPGEIAPSGAGGRIVKEDVLRHVEQLQQKPASNSAAPASAAEPAPSPAPSAPAQAAQPTLPVGGISTPLREEQVVAMTRLRKTVAERLVQAQHNAALLTTFNEVDMTEAMALRKTYQEAFLEKYGIKLGFMSFFVKAAIDALRLIPALNAEIRGTDIVYRNFADIGVAIGGGRGLVVPVLRNAERMGFAEVELAIADLAKRAKDNKLKLDELQGGTFTISNGGVYGSLLSTPIVNPPQSGILGMHSIQDRPVARAGQVVIRPMMYIALTYDHRIVDGREAVTFLKRIKDAVENPARILLEV